MTPPEVPVADGVTAERVATGATWCEGPLWLPDERVVIFSDIPGDRILAYSPERGTCSPWRTGVEFMNGRAHHPLHGIVHASHGRRAIEGESGAILVDDFDGVRLNSPNDIAVHSDGAIWFTDPPYGIQQEHEGYPGEPEYGGCYVFRLDPDGTLAPVVRSIVRPNGIVFSPDERVLYIADSAAALGDGPGRHILAFTVTADGRGVEETDGRIVAEVTPGVPDGMDVDVDGRIWSSSGTGVQVFTPDGAKVAEIAVPETVANVTFGGPDGSDLYATATTSLYRIPTLTRGAHL